MAKEDLKPFKKGKDPRRNTTGKNKGCISLKRKLREALDKIHEGTGTRYDELFVQATMKDGIKVDGQSRKLIWQYIEGMPIQTQQIGFSYIDQIISNVNKTAQKQKMENGKPVSDNQQEDREGDIPTE